MHNIKQVSLKSRAEYFSEWLVNNIAPTIAGSKPATILTLADSRYLALLSMWRSVGDTVLDGTIIRSTILHSSEDKETILFFRDDSLEECISARENRRFLEELGYPVSRGLDLCLELLKQRFLCCCPHEIGVLLGIPLKDVLGFMGLTNSGITCRAEWCIYGQPDDSLALIKRYAQDRENICGMIRRGVSPHQILRGTHDHLPQAV